MRKRITPKSFIAAVKRTGTVPARCLWIRERKKDKDSIIEVCAIGALCIDATQKTKINARQWARSPEGLGLSNEYITGFITGFDGRKSYWDKISDQHAAWEDGVACAVAAFEEKLHEEYEISWSDDPSPWMDPERDESEENFLYCWS